MKIRALDHAQRGLAPRAWVDKLMALLGLANPRHKRSSLLPEGYFPELWHWGLNWHN